MCFDEPYNVKDSVRRVFLARNKAERSLRWLIQQQTPAAITLQAFARGHQVRRRLQQEYRQLLDVRLKDLTLALSHLPPSAHKAVKSAALPNFINQLYLGFTSTLHLPSAAAWSSWHSSYVHNQTVPKTTAPQPTAGNAFKPSNLRAFTEIIRLLIHPKFRLESLRKPEYYSLLFQSPENDVFRLLAILSWMLDKSDTDGDPATAASKGQDHSATQESPLFYHFLEGLSSHSRHEQLRCILLCQKLFTCCLAVFFMLKYGFSRGSNRSLLQIPLHFPIFQSAPKHHRLNTSSTLQYDWIVTNSLLPIAAATPTEAEGALSLCASALEGFGTLLLMLFRALYPLESYGCTDLADASPSGLLMQEKEISAAPVGIANTLRYSAIDQIFRYLTEHARLPIFLGDSFELCFASAPSNTLQLLRSQLLMCMETFINLQLIDTTLHLEFLCALLGTPLLMYSVEQLPHVNKLLNKILGMCLKGLTYSTLKNLALPPIVEITAKLDRSTHTLSTWMLGNVLQLARIAKSFGLPLPSSFLTIAVWIYRGVPFAVIRSALADAKDFEIFDSLQLQQQLKVLVDRQMVLSFVRFVEKDWFVRLPIFLLLYFSVPLFTAKLALASSTPVEEDEVDAEEHEWPYDVSSEFISSFLKTFDLKLPGTDHVVLSILSTSSSLPHKLFQSISDTVTETCASNYDRFVALLYNEPRTYPTPLVPALLCFCLMLLYQLEVMYDYEILENPIEKQPSTLLIGSGFLTLQRLKWLSGMLNEIAWKLIKLIITNPTARKQNNILNLKNVISLLVRELYDRNSRLHYFQAEDWVLKEAFPLLKPYTVLMNESDESPFSQHTRTDRAHSVIEDIIESSTPFAKELLSAILLEIPHCIPFDSRILIFYRLVSNDKKTTGNFENPFAVRFHHSIRRDYLLEDGLATLGSLEGSQLKNAFRVRFVDEFGNEEAGIDGGGLFKEFLIRLSRTAFDPTCGLFQFSADNALYPSPSAYVAHGNALALFTFLGKICGKALYEKILIEPQFSKVFLNLLLNRPNKVDDVPSLDPDLHKNLLYLKKYDGDASAFSLTFSVTVSNYDSNEERDLIPNGNSIPVTNDTKLQYMLLMAHYKTTKQIEQQTKAFLQGLSSIIPLSWLRMLSPDEFQMLLSGTSEGFDVKDLKLHTRYSGGFEEDSPCITWFWEVLAEMDLENRSEFLMFVTSSSRPPLVGFRNLNPQFTIHKVPGSTRFPSSSTCVNLFKLPDYEDKATLKDKLQKAIKGTKGFGLS